MNFKQFSTSDNQWHDIPYYQHKTATDTLTLPATLYPNDTSVTVGIKGNTTQSGTPSPSNPVDVNGTGERTAQLFEDKISSCNIGADGKLTGNPSYDMLLAEVQQGVTYTTSATITGGFFTTKPVIGSISYDGQRMAFANATFTAPITGYLAFRVSAGTTAMINVGETSLPYEPYGYKIPILSGGTTTPVYLGEVQTTRQIKKLVLTGEEAFTKNDGQSTHYLYYANRGVILPSSIGKTPILCNELPVKNSTPQSEIGINTDNKFSVVYFNFGADVMNAQTSGNTVAGLKEYLASQYANGTPVCVWYVLATPQTGITNEPLMKIGNYSDTLTTSIPCTAGENSFDVDTTVAPSEVTAGFSGWHPVQNVHERENGQWD